MATATVLGAESPNRWRYLNNILNRRGPYTDEAFTPGDEPKAFLADAKILVMYVCSNSLKRGMDLH
ncbi:hypothetical protein TWF696_002815 [Orbilia brochopaga]|uniref:Uncharacterized protein n=1 Tax=Orbilia brochopaga TaxID=3140254 RepID=A0AAV9U4C7_9PEZI